MSKNKVLKEYGIATIKGTLGAVPYVGTFLNEIVFDARSRLKQDRVNSFIEEFGKYIEELGIEKISPEELDPEKIGDILEEIITSVSKTSAEHKRNVLKKILLKQFNDKSEEVDETIRFIKITNEITLLQLKILEVFFRLSDNVIRYKLHILKLEEELQEIQTSKSEALKKYKITSKTVQNLIEREQEINKLLKKKISALQKGDKNPNFHKTFGVKRDIYIVEIQDLIAKGLLFDFAIQTDLVDPNVLFGITKLGRRYMQYILQ